MNLRLSKKDRAALIDRMSDDGPSVFEQYRPAKKPKQPRNKRRAPR